MDYLSLTRRQAAVAALVKRERHAAGERAGFEPLSPASGPRRRGGARRLGGRVHALNLVDLAASGKRGQRGSHVPGWPSLCSGLVADGRILLESGSEDVLRSSGTRDSHRESVTRLIDRESKERATATFAVDPQGDLLLDLGLARERHDKAILLLANMADRGQHAPRSIQVRCPLFRRKHIQIASDHLVGRQRIIRASARAIYRASPSTQHDDGPNRSRDGNRHDTGGFVDVAHDGTRHAHTQGGEQDWRCAGNGTKPQPGCTREGGTRERSGS